MANSNDGADGGARSPSGKFKAGASGNPRGRPKGAKNRYTIIRDVLAEVVPVQLRGRKKKIATSEAAIRVLVKKALSGEMAAIRDVIQLWAQVEEAAEKAREPEFPFTEADREVVAEIHARMKACKEPGKS